MHKLIIKNLKASIENKVILNDFNIEINSGEIHAIMGPNGTGKSTLSKIIMGDPNYKILSGEIYFDDKLINDLSIEKRAQMGLFLGMQMPPEIEGVTNADFLRTALHTKEGKAFKLMNFINELDKTCEELSINKNMIHRSVNQGFSGGERKKNEILQLKLLKPNMIILDEIDSGLDVDSLKIVGENVIDYFKNSDAGILLITHYQRLLDYIKPDYIHIMMDGKIIKSGDATLVSILEEKGYDFIKNELSDFNDMKEVSTNE
ncbi:MAG: Fe-S cluster assembly ATPase SufC [Bacilli bacterium]|nr:Fe-S cluster assembly ATPase SufC [Bacilli bacterium]